MAAGVAYTSGGCFYPVLRMRKVVRLLGLILCESIILLSPLLIPSDMPFRRLVASILAVRVAVSVYDLYADATQRTGPGPIAFIISLFHPFVLVWRRVLTEPRGSFTQNLTKFAVNCTVGIIAAGLFAATFFVPWQQYPFILEYCCKVIGFFLMVQFLPNGIAAFCRLIGIPATDFAGNFFLARTPAEFWRRYNRPTNQFLHEHVFKPAGGRQHPIRAMLLVFLFSGVMHEYVFDIAAPSIMGFQLLLFTIHGVAVVLTARLRPVGWKAAPAVLATFAFNLITAWLFFHCLDATVPFFVRRG
ncbi:MAG TPA: MBOAT family O-acyltransferase [Tepidisphaeraceae bacterium]|nr:MBOAT family O-acyltransferase [Tepidisphaeraceae bacterium]